ncbi:hypothetical protein FPQ18DRAFT_353143 [Pyronema domesticum]|nr:hypothetical protein FPQ18DRAFT_353143 [Pyronema domesticum]
MMEHSETTTEMTVYFGGCICTLVRYRIYLPKGSFPSLTQSSCTQCRKSVASLQASFVTVPANSISWATRQLQPDQPPGYSATDSGSSSNNGAVNDCILQSGLECVGIPWPYKEFADARGVIRGFCEWCSGNVLMKRTQSEGAETLVSAGSLDEPRPLLEGGVVISQTCYS